MVTLIHKIKFVFFLTHDKLKSNPLKERCNMQNESLTINPENPFSIIATKIASASLFQETGETTEAMNVDSVATINAGYFSSEEAAKKATQVFAESSNMLNVLIALENIDVNDSNELKELVQQAQAIMNKIRA